MNQRQRRLEIGVAQIGEHRLELPGRQHALVDQGVRRQARHVEGGPALERRSIDGVLHPLADDVELALEPPPRVRIARARPVVPPPDEDLGDERLHRDGTLAHQAVVGRHVSPAQQHLPFFADDTREEIRDRLPQSWIARQKDRADAVLARRRQRDAEPSGFPAQKLVGHLHEDAGAVARVGLAAAGAAVLQIRQDLEGLADDFVGSAAADIHDEADATGIVLVGGIVQPLPGVGRRIRHGSVCMRDRGPYAK